MKAESVALVAAILLTLLLVPAVGSAQGRGRGRDNFRWNKKCEKFVNCHDARDGRRDNRGPRRQMLGRYYSPYYRDRYFRYSRNRIYRTYPRVRFTQTYPGRRYRY